MAEKKTSKLVANLELNEFKLNSLLEITKGINNNASIQNILKIFEYIIREQLGVSKLILYAYDHVNWSCILHFGSKGLNKKIHIDNDLIHIREITVIESSSQETLNSFDIVIPIIHKKTPLAYLLIGELNDGPIKINPSIKHMSFIQTLTNIVIVAIENKRFSKALVEQEIQKKEMAVAAEMQKLLFPTELPSNNRIEVAARYETKHLVGGDYYDFIPLNNEEYLFCIADVSGKGVSAALLMSNFQAKLRANVKYNHKNMSLKDLVYELNDDVNNAAKGEKFITFFVGHYNCENMTLQYINAGHNYPILCNGTESKFLNSGCIGLGMLEKIPSIKVEKIHIDKNDVLICYTDGIVELENPHGEAFETENLVAVVQENFNLSVQEIDNKIFDALNVFKKQNEIMDDTALMSCRFL